MTAASPRFQMDCWTALTVVRSLFGLAAIGLAVQQLPRPAAAALVLCVWFDAALGWVARHRNWSKSASVVQVEGLADFLCYAWSPAQLAWSICAAWQMLPLLAVFVLACVYRLARFNVEGLQSGRYTGLPVTYNGYWIPLAALACWTIPGAQHLLIFLGVFGVVSYLMVSGRFTTPEL